LVFALALASPRSDQAQVVQIPLHEIAKVEQTNAAAIPVIWLCFSVELRPLFLDNKAVNTNHLPHGLNGALVDGLASGGAGHVEDVAGHVALRRHLGLRDEQPILPECPRDV
jgi:hypothetical protein